MLEELGVNGCLRLASLLLATSLLATPVLPSSETLGAPPIIEHDVRVAFAGDGTILTTTLLRLAPGDDLVPWTPLELVLRDHETLEAFSAVADEGDRPARRVRGVRHRASLSIIDGTEHSVLTTHWFELPAVPETATVSFRYSVSSTPFFPEGAIEIPLDDPCRSARIEISEPPPGFRYRIREGPEVRHGEGQRGIVVTRSSRCGSGDPFRPRAPLVLHFAWGSARSWGELGRLYFDLLQRTPSAGDEIERQALRLTAAGADTLSDRLDVLIDFVQRDIRYVAVERGEGWYLPASPSMVLARGWGDCKDKALLLSRLLAAAGIESQPALIDSRPGGDFDPAFPRLSAFDHLIVAVNMQSLGNGGEKRWVFVDPTMSPSSGFAPRTDLLGRYALVLRDDGLSSLEIVTTIHRPDQNESAGDRCEDTEGL